MDRIHQLVISSSRSTQSPAATKCVTSINSSLPFVGFTGAGSESTTGELHPERGNSTNRCVKTFFVGCRFSVFGGFYFNFKLDFSK